MASLCLYTAPGDCRYNLAMNWPVLRRYDRDRLREISMPIGGIGTGFFTLGGRGDLRDFQLMNRPHRGWKPMYAHLLLWTRAGHETKLRVIEGELTDGFAADSGNPEVFAAIPRFDSATFEASYPFGRVLLADGDTPVEVFLEGFNPLIPHATDDSSLPFGLLSVTFHNKTDESIEGSLSFLGSNIIGCDGLEFDLKDNVTERTSLPAGGWSGMSWSKAREERKPTMGTMAILMDGDDVRVARRWRFRDKPWEGERLGIIDELLAKGFIEDDDPEAPCPPSPQDTWDSSIHSLFKLGPNETRTIKMLIAWHFPWRDVGLGWQFSGTTDQRIRQNHYATRFADATSVATHVASHLDALVSQTQDFVTGIVNRKTPESIREAALFNLAVLNSHTCFRLEDGSFFGFEGCNSDTGCCFGSCTHVWNYENATIDLFPELHRSMIENHLRYGVTATGAQRFRQTLPVQNATWNLAAADGEMGLIVRVLHQFRTDRNKEWLKAQFPQVKRMIEFAWEPGGWDANRDGVMEGSQHNTYDVEFFGPNPMCTVYYLAALHAAATMADEMNDAEFAAECRRIAQGGSKWVDENLYNGRFFYQRIEPSKGDYLDMTGDSPATQHPPFQVGPGCLIDQLVGQFKANRVGLGDLLDRFHIRTTLQSIYKNNYRSNFKDHYHNMRTFVAQDDSGTLICSYPDGGRPAIPFSYWGECMTGFEYQLAVLLLDYGFKSEGLQVAKAVRDRHDGRNRNPFNEPECGSFYARSMTSWSLLDAWDSKA